MIIRGHIIDPVQQRRFNGELHIQNGRILRVVETTETVPNRFILPGFVDAHIHIESSMLVPSEFARLAVRHGTVATISDPHEIANVCGREGVEFMIENGATVPLKFHFGAPSCVPATGFETAGAVLPLEDVEALLDRDDIVYLAEMMNWPGVLARDPEVMNKIEAALKRGKPVDGHAPGLKGQQAQAYIEAGISTDHECFTREEALDKLSHGMKIIIREGSAAKNYDALHTLISSHPKQVMFCSDDKHPDDLLRGHINALVARSLDLGYDLMDVLSIACVHPVKHYAMNVGLLQEGDWADFIVVDNLHTMHLSETWIDGTCVWSNDTVHFQRPAVPSLNHFFSYELAPSDFQVAHTGLPTAVIVAFDGELITGRTQLHLPSVNGCIACDPEQDVLKIAVVNRYKKAPPAIGFIKHFGLKHGAIASSVAHDSHNIVVVGDSDKAIARAVNLVMEQKGGISLVNGSMEEVVGLPIAGIMSDASGEQIGEAYERLSNKAKEMGSTLKAPYMLISFMALLVIPSLKMSDLGLFDAERFEFVA